MDQTTRFQFNSKIFGKKYAFFPDIKSNCEVQHRRKIRNSVQTRIFKNRFISPVFRFFRAHTEKLLATRAFDIRFHYIKKT